MKKNYITQPEVALLPGVKKAHLLDHLRDRDMINIVINTACLD